MGISTFNHFPLYLPVCSLHKQIILCLKSSSSQCGLQGPHLCVYNWYRETGFAFFPLNLFNRMVIGKLFKELLLKYLNGNFAPGLSPLVIRGAERGLKSLFPPSALFLHNFCAVLPTAAESKEARSSR